MSVLPVGLASSANYAISRSLRFNSADSAYLNRTPASAGNRKTWTWSGWVKRSALSATDAALFTCGYNADANQGSLRFMASTPDAFEFFQYDSAYSARLITTQVFRDVSAWYHILLAFDSTQTTASNRIKLYVNGVQVSAFSTATYPSQNYDGNINTANAHAIGRYSPSSSQYFNGYLTEVNFIDGQALTPSSFGVTDPNTGIWSPIKYTGTYGTNGFYLNFSDNSGTTSTTLGKDSSGNGNNWTPNNFSVTAGAGNDSLVDVPTSWGSDTGVGGEVRGNYATWNPLTLGASATLANGNLDISYVAATRTATGSTFGMLSNKWYWEVTITASSNATATSMIGLTSNSATNSISYPGSTSTSWGYYGADGTKYVSASGSAYGATFAVNDVIGVAFDADAGTLTFYKNGVSQGTAFSSLTSGPYFPAIGNGTTAHSFSAVTNFGQRPFAYTAPSGFKALCTTNLPEPSIKQGNAHFDVVIRNGFGSSGGSITGLKFQPDLVWEKVRSTSSSHTLWDAVRGIPKALRSDSTAAELDQTWLTSFNSSGLTFGTNDYGTTVTLVEWLWKANGTGVSNTAGSITSTVSANPTAGFSVVTYTGTAANATVGHGLGVAPRLIIIKARTGAANDWWVYSANLANTQFLKLNTTDAVGTSSTLWNSSSPTSTVFSLGNNAANNPVNYVAYCFAQVDGYSAFGSYTGNGSTDGPFVYLGFRPRYVLIKATSGTNAGTSSWPIFDTARDTENICDALLYTNLSDAEVSSGNLDIVSNGFKLRTNANRSNELNTTYIYMAFAEAPFKYALAR